jgi:hypothetical protein
LIIKICYRGKSKLPFSDPITEKIYLYNQGKKNVSHLSLEDYEKIKDSLPDEFKMDFED